MASIRSMYQVATRAQSLRSLMIASRLAHVKTQEAINYQTTLKFEAPVEPLETWLNRQPLSQLKDNFDRDGYVRVNNILEPALVVDYQKLYDQFVSGVIDASRHRHDLGSHNDPQASETENVLQVMWPSDYVELLVSGPLHARSLAIAQHLLGGADIAFDFDMMIAKAPYTNTDIPWHQDEAYWLDMPDKRAVSCWTALDEARQDNGCMWFVPGSHHGDLLPHERAKAGEHALKCTSDNVGEGVCVPLPAGSCTFHAGRTLHQTLGNTTQTQRRAYILNYRPKAMVDFSREQGFDHGRQDGVHGPE
eukprot:TRINITY_DN8190_c0_g1_i4.p1 TRINITY_DN8190_c0_g1~~TRINITY_DN8190_c0_g1_i4.p1  ORF type:complete len:306 (+),score=54.75 TRINITY_DN8190_c0_g1_i4:168-1085(+)